MIILRGTQRPKDVTEFFTLLHLSLSRRASIMPRMKWDIVEGVANRQAGAPSANRLAVRGSTLGEL